MSANPQIAAPGSSTYDSNTLHVGDGTWDSGRDDFLLPNLMGLNFATMRYNGMGNRFKGLPEYHDLIRAHGVIAAMTFLFIIPAAIFTARFYHRNARLALRLHIWLQILTVFLATVVLVLGWFAVGPRRSLTNPHHGIGLAIYVLILFQALYGSLVHHIEKGKIRYRIPLRLMLHQWLGRAIALLGIIQVALGLTLYGSPKVLFILYAVWGFILLVAYFVLSFQHQTVLGAGTASYYSGSRVGTIDESPRHDRHTGRLGTLGALLGAGALATALKGRNRSRSRSRSRSRTRTSVTGTSRRESGSFIDEKYSEADGSRRNHTWRDRLLGVGAGVGILAAARNLFGGGRRREDEESSSVSDYPHHPLGGSTEITQTDISRVEEGRVPMTPERRSGGIATVPTAVTSPSRPGRSGGRRTSGGSIQSFDSQSSYYSPGRAKRNTHTFRDAVATVGVAGWLKHRFSQKRDRQDDRRVEEMRRRDRQNERINRQGSGSRRRFTGDGVPARVQRRHGSITESEMTPLGGSNPELSLNNLPRPPGAAGGSRGDVTAANTYANSNVPPPPPMPGAAVHDSSGSEAYLSAGGRQRHRHSRGESVAAAALGAAAGAAVGGAATSRHERNTSRRRASSGAPSINSPPVSVKVKMHNDGRHVTLRRLNDAEAAAERERRNRRGRAGSISSIGASGDEHWRRVEQREAEQAAATEEQQHNLPPPGMQLPGPPPMPPPPPSQSGLGGQSIAGPSTLLSDLPPPPPIPGGSGLGVGGSPGSIYTSGPSAVGSRAESNRKRRRAERAMARQQGKGNRVDFT